MWYLSKCSGTKPSVLFVVKQILCVPARTAGVERLFSIAGHILGIRRTRLSDENYESFLFANVNFDLDDVAVGKKFKLQRDQRSGNGGRFSSTGRQRQRKNCRSTVNGTGNKNTATGLD